MLLLLTEENLQTDLKMTNGIIRKRFCLALLFLLLFLFHFHVVKDLKRQVMVQLRALPTEIRKINESDFQF